MCTFFFHRHALMHLVRIHFGSSLAGFRHPYYFRRAGFRPACKLQHSTMAQGKDGPYGKGKDEPKGKGGGDKGKGKGKGQVAGFHVFIRDQNHNLVRVDMDPPATVRQFIADCVGEFFEGGEDDNPSISDLYLTILGGDVLALPMDARLDAVVESGLTVVLSRLVD